jgi:hypothetical protein
LEEQGDKMKKSIFLEMRKLTFLELIEKVLREARKPMTAEEIWRYAQSKKYDELVATKGKTPWRTIGAQIYLNIRDDQESPFVKIDSKPKKFFLKDMVDKEEYKKIVDTEEKVIQTPSETGYSEIELHPFLAYYAYTYMEQVYVKTIRHQTSSGKGYAQWLHPDLVGVYYPIGKWQPDVLDLGMAAGSKLLRLYSFEMKKELTFSNIRESFFQTVSNSSWANEGYLVTAKVSQDDEFMDELSRLSGSFGIGIIRLDTEDQDSSEVLFPAKFKPDLDWDTINKLAKENADFRKLMVRIKNDLSSKEVRKEEYDPVGGA